MNGLLSLPFANLLRRPMRSALTAAGVALACAALFSLISFERGYQSGLRAEMDRLGAHVLVVPKGCPYDAASIALHGANWPCYLKSDYVATVRTTRHVAVAAPVFMSAVYDRERQVVYCGVEPDFARLKPGWKVTGHWPQSAGEILVGSDAAATNHWQIGQQVALPGIEGRSARVAGIIGRTDGADDLFTYMRLADAQRIFKRPGQITHMLVRLDDPAHVDQVVGDLRGCGAGLEMNVVPLAHLLRMIEDLVATTRLLLGSVALIGLLVAAAGVGNTILMAVAERTREIGVLRAIGASQAHVFGLIWLETVVLCALGGLAGIVGAILSAHAVEGWIRGRIPFAPTGDLLRPEWLVAGGCLLAMVVVGTLSGTIPALRAARLSPVAAIRSRGNYA